MSCEPCEAEIPEIQKAYEQHQDHGFVVLAVNFGEKAEKAKTFAEKWELSFPVLVDRRANVVSQYSVVSLPVSLFIDSEGLVRERVFGGDLDGYRHRPNPPAIDVRATTTGRR
jgi:peroxiredoxin